MRKNKSEPTIKMKVQATCINGSTYYIHKNGLVAFEREDGRLGWLTGEEFIAIRRSEQRKQDATDLQTGRYTAQELQDRNSWIAKVKAIQEPWCPFEIETEAWL